MMTKTTNRIISLAFAASIASIGSIANAGQQTTNFQASAQLQSTCALQIDDFKFGTTAYSYDQTTLAELSVTCSKGVNAVATISAGNSSDFTRYMTDGTPESDKLMYKLYLPGDASRIVGDGTNGTITIQITGTGSPVYKWISGSVLRGQYLKPGNYSDSLTMTLTY